MNILVDTNVLLRLSDTGSDEHMLCTEVVPRLLQRGDLLHICAQVVVEYWVVATRPQTVNGLGFEPEETKTELRDFEKWFAALPEPDDITRRWRRIVNQYRVCGKPAHDARLVAFMEAHGLTQILTLNTADFARYTMITAVHPSDVR